jgi:predicted amidophosphoribosyltransferase
MPRLIDDRRCPHCGVELPEPKPRSCPKCAGSLQKRFHRIGCLSGAPPVLLAALGLWLAWRAFAA